MRPIYLSILATIVAAWSPPAALYDPQVASRMLATATSSNNPPLYPNITTTAGTWLWSGANTWTTGFYTSAIFQLHKRECLCPGSTRVGGSIPDWLSLGREWASGIVPLHYNNVQGHNVGFLSWPFVEDLSLDPTNEDAKDNIIEFALELSSRYNSVVNSTRSWNTLGNSTGGAAEATDFIVIIENLMNLELLLQAHKLTGNQTFKEIAIKHADRTLNDHFRADWGTWQVVIYHSETGAIKRKITSQGYSDSSTWARGEAWALHGYTRLYQWTGLPRYLNAARNIAALFLRRAAARPAYLPWDFDAPPSPPPSADSSAAMIAAAALQLLSAAERTNGQHARATQWQQGSQWLLTQTASYAWKPTGESLLSNGTRDNNAGGNPNLRSNGTGLPYTDYFWIKTGNYLLETGVARCPGGRASTRRACGSDLRVPSF